MTIERRIVIGLEDIKAIIFECNSCLSRVGTTPQVGKHMHIPKGCPQCGAKWSLLDPIKYGDHDITPYANFVTSIERMRSFTKETTDAVGFTILLEFQEPKLP
ncbi:MAG TPA: hypothetical protein VE959_23840 [Bryobacteraceae bacterium]|nr:hypothetical protein [Bryobacteraceae bacterium]